MPGCQMVQTLNGFQNLYKKSGLGMFLQWGLKYLTFKFRTHSKSECFKDRYWNGQDTTTIRKQNWFLRIQDGIPKIPNQSKTKPFTS